MSDAAHPRLVRRIEARPRLVLGGVVVASLLMAWMNRFIQDDAFISFRYADQLVRGHGLVWNPGERVEGYTNFLWTVWMAVPLRLGWDPVAFAMASGLACFTLSLLFTHRLAARVLTPGLALLVVALLGTHYTFSSYATGGLETQLQACLFTAALALMANLNSGEAPVASRLALLSLVLALAVLTRPDSALLVAVVLPVAAVVTLRSSASAPHRAGRMVALVSPLLLIVGAWLAWKTAYYGSLLPNTAQVKLLSGSSIAWGLGYLYLFLDSYWLFPCLALGVLSLPRLARPGTGVLRMLVALIALWLGYVVRVGGDFMEFRLLVPVLPAVFVLLVWSLHEQVKAQHLRLLFVALVAAGSLHHALTFRVRQGVESIALLHAHVRDDDDAWALAGRVLGAALEHDPGVVIATTAAGAIPFHSRLTTVDMLGLNDPWVARHGVYTDPRPGHQRVAPYAYLERRRVHLLIGPPQVLPRDSLPPASADAREVWSAFLAVPPSPTDRLPATARILNIPLDPARKLVVLYLHPHPRIEAAIQRFGWRVRPADTSPRAL